MENSGYQLKTTTVFVMLIWFANLVIAQDTAQYNLDKKTRHEIGLNLSGMIRLTNADNRDTAGSYQQNDFLTYRYYFKKSSIRAAMAANYAEQDFVHEISAINAMSEIPLQTRNKYIRLRLGYERVKELSNKWLLYYGVDAFLYKQKYSHDFTNYAEFNFRYYLAGENANVFEVGAGPILGLRLKLNERISLIAESSIYVTMFEKKYYNYYTNTYSFDPQVSNSPKYTKRETRIDFNNPLNLMLTFSF